MLFWKEDITEIYFVNKYQSKNQKQRYKIQKLLCKCRIKTPRKALGLSLRFLTVWRRCEWIILSVSIAHFILFLFCSKLPEKRYGVRTIAAEPPPSPTTS